MCSNKSTILGSIANTIGRLYVTFTFTTYIFCISIPKQFATANMRRSMIGSNSQKLYVELKVHTIGPHTTSASSGEQSEAHTCICTSYSNIYFSCSRFQARFVRARDPKKKRLSFSSEMPRVFSVRRFYYCYWKYRSLLFQLWKLHAPRKRTHLNIL
jgi:hypothetical protein